MKFKEKLKKACQVKNLSAFCLILLFLWWGSKAMVRYRSQPLSTDISYIYGETKLGVQFPQISLCHRFLYYPIMNECHDGSYSFISTFATCMKRNKSVELMQNFHPEIGHIVEMVQFWTGSEYVSLWPLYKNVWTRAFLIDGGYYSGPCYTFDLSKVDKFKYVSLENAGRPGIEFVMTEKNPWQTVGIMLHTRFDLQDAYALNGYFIIPFSDKIKEVHQFDVQKKINKRESTRKVPCEKYEYRTCQSIEKSKAIYEKFGCSIPILYAGEVLDNFIQKDMSNCSYDITLKALDFYLNEGVNCSMTQTCESARFKSGYRVEKTWTENKTLLYVVFENIEVEHHESYISYDLMSLISEIGGLLGLTLGASALTLFASIFKRIPYY